MDLQKEKQNILGKKRKKCEYLQKHPHTTIHADEHVCLTIE